MFILKFQAAIYEAVLSGEPCVILLIEVVVVNVNSDCWQIVVAIHNIVEIEPDIL